MGIKEGVMLTLLIKIIAVVVCLMFSLLVFFGILYCMIWLVSGKSSNCCGSCGKSLPEEHTDWKEYCTGSCSETDWGDYWLCPECQIKHGK